MTLLASDRHLIPGAPWLGSFPGHWQVRPIWSMYRREKRTGYIEEPMVSVFREYGVVFKEDFQNLNVTAEDRSIYQLVEPGWLVVNRMKAWQGSVGVSALRGISSGHYICFRPLHEGSHRFYNWLFRSSVYRDGFAQYSRGVRPGQAEIDNDQLQRLPVLVPPLDEQRAIADFLDRETAKIDALMEKQHTIVELLRERRAAAIRRVLTRGLQLNASTRPSDIPLIESLPSHWATVPLRHLCRITTGAEDSGNADPGGQYPFYVRGQEILRIDSYGFDGEAVLTPGDGQGGTGKVFHYTQGKFQAHQRVYVFIGFRGVLGRYVYYWLSTFLKAIALAGSNTVTMESLRRPLLASVPVALPPPSEQQAIVERLDREATTIDALIAKAEEFIALARERRAALITAAVTGQIKVMREAS